MRLVTDFRKYKVLYSAAIRDLYFILRAAILEAKAEGHLKMFINEQTLPNIMSKTRATDWKKLAKIRPARMKEEVEVVFGKIMEQKRRDNFNAAAA